MSIMLITASYLLSLFVLASSLKFEESTAGLSSRADSGFGSGYSSSLGHLLPRNARPYLDSFLDGQAYNIYLSRRNAEPRADAGAIPGSAQLYARKPARRPPARRPTDNAGSAGSASKIAANDKKAASSQGSAGKPPTGKASPEIDKSIKLTAATLKEKYNWPPPNYGSMTPQERRVAAGKARAKQTRENTDFVRGQIAKIEGSENQDTPSTKARSRSPSKDTSPSRDTGSPKLPISSGSSSQTAFGPSSQSAPAIQGTDQGKTSRASSRKSSGVLVNTPDLLSPAHSGVSGGWTLLDQQPTKDE